MNGGDEWNSNSNSNSIYWNAGGRLVPHHHHNDTFDNALKEDYSKSPVVHGGHSDQHGLAAQESDHSHRELWLPAQGLLPRFQRAMSLPLQPVTGGHAPSRHMRGVSVGVSAKQIEKTPDF